MLDGFPVHPTRILAKYKDQAQSKSHAAALPGMGLRARWHSTLAPGLTALDLDDQAPGKSRVADEATLRSRLSNRMEALRKTGLFEYVEPDYIVHAYAAPTDQAFVDGTLWGLRNLGNPGADIDAMNAWDVTTGSTNVIVAVIDSGIRYTHVELASQMWRNPNEIPGNGIDDDNNGFVDDVHGINAIRGTGDPFDDNDHGSHCSGTIGAAANDGNPHVGVAWNVRLMGCKFLGASGGGAAADAITCIDYAVTNGARILNNSWGGGGYSQALYDSIKAAGDRGVLFVAAAGNEYADNDEDPHYPASYPLENIISVAAVDRDDNLADFSNYGKTTVHLGAPGVEIFSCTAESDTSYAEWPGTSMAAPHVSGVAALVLSAEPDLTLAELKDRILSGVVPIPALEDTTITGGRLNARNCLGGAPSGVLQVIVDPPSGATLLRSSSQVINATVTDRFSISDATVTAQVVGVTNLVLNSLGYNGIYSATLSVPAATNPLTMNLVATAPGKVGFTNTYYYNVVPPPANDHFASATKAPAAGTTYFSNNRFATLEEGEPYHFNNTNVTASLWWTWSPSANTNVILDTTGSSVDTVLAVYTGTVLSNLTHVISTNSNVPQHRRAAVTFNASSNTTYRIAVASAASYSLGSIQLRIALGGSLDTTPPTLIISGPGNGDIVTNRQVAVSGTAADPAPNATGVAEVLVSVNGQIGSFANGTTNWLAPAMLRPGQNSIAVYSTDRAGNRSPTATLQLTYVVPPPPNDFFVNAIALSGTNGAATVNTTNATREVNEPFHAGNAGGKSVWWTFTPPADGMLTLDTASSDFDTLLALYTGSSINNLTLVASNDDAYEGVPGGTSRIVQAVRSGQTYRIALDGYDALSGTAHLAYQFSPATVYHLAVATTPGGTASPMSVDVPANQVVTLTATPDAYSQFDLWDGDVVSLSSDLTLAVNRNLNLTARFRSVAFTDGFESGNLSQIGWTGGGNKPWVVQTNYAAAGMYAARSGVITHSQTSSLILASKFFAGTGSFVCRVSSEQNYDYLRFYVDGVLLQSWSGEIPWTGYSFPLTAGQHTLEWRYVKDSSGSAGLDAAFLDNVSLPLVVGTNASTPAHLGLRRQSNGIYFVDLSGQTNQQYIIQVSTNLVHWRNFSTNIATGGILRVPDPASTTNRIQFYRAVVIP